MARLCLSGFFFALIFACISSSHPQADAQLQEVRPAGKLYVEFRARSPSAASYGKFGHIFIATGREYENGLIVYEKIVGFYPDSKLLPNQDGVDELCIYSKDSRSETAQGCIGLHFNDLGESETFRVQVSEAQYNSVEHMLRSWEHSESYTLLLSDCVSFADAIARRLHLNTPTQITDSSDIYSFFENVFQFNDWPINYLRRLRKINEDSDYEQRLSEDITAETTSWLENYNAQAPILNRSPTIIPYDQLVDRQRASRIGTQRGRIERDPLSSDGNGSAPTVLNSPEFKQGADGANDIVCTVDFCLDLKMRTQTPSPPLQFPVEAPSIDLGRQR